MSDSSLVNKQWWANPTNYAKGRTSNIKGIVIHHAASTSLNSIGQVFSQAGRKGSAHYGVGGSEIHQYVHECDTAWHCSNRNGNNATIGIETTNSTREPNWEVSDLTLSTLIKLVADVAKRNNLGWLSVNPSADYPTISGHKDWKGASTACPGPYLYPRLQYIADEANKINFPPKPVEVTWVPMDTPRTLITNAGATLVSLPSLGAVKNYEEGVALECDQKCIFNGKTYIRTKYSTSKGISNGFDFDQLHEVPAPEPPKPEWADIAIKKIQAIRETNLIDIVSGEVQKTYPEATIVEVTQECVFNDNKFYRTEYSKNRDVSYGFIASDFQDYVEPIPEPIPEPEPTPELTSEPEPEPSDEKEREETVNILQKIIDFINRIIKLITTKKEN